jgi:dTDP-4-amino-4,6-dideoxygalactose transaminase
LIPFNKPAIIGQEIQNIFEALENGKLAGDGEFTKKCEAKLIELTDTKACLLTHSCTAALEMAAILLDLKKGDEVIMPSYTFVSTANAVVLRGAIPVFVDIRADTLNIDETKIEAAITKQTKAIFVVHYAGVVCEMDKILALSSRYEIPIVEDAAQALTSTYKGKKAGSFGVMSCFSFHETKNIISGEGGCLCINDETLIERAEIVREKGTNRKNFLNGLTDKYTWVDIGSSYVPSELIAAYLYAQLSYVQVLQKKRLEYWNKYHKHFTENYTELFETPQIPKHVVHNGHLYYLICKNTSERDLLIQKLRSEQIVAPFHYVPLHNSPGGKNYCKTVGSLNHTIDRSEKLLRLPLFHTLDTGQDKVISVIDKLFQTA